MKPLTAVMLSILVAIVITGAVTQFTGLRIGDPGDQVTVVHWTTGHLLRTGSGLRLLDQMAKEFNAADKRTDSGKRIKVEVHYASGATQWPELVSRVNNGVAKNPKLPNPTLVTPSASHWLVKVNFETGREVIDLRDTESRSLAKSYAGIVTYRDMAECLGWPNREIGYADIIALRDDPRGWASYPCAKAGWGERALLAYTDPSTSDTGRAVLFMLYAIAAGKSPEDLTLADLARPEVVDYVKNFQGLVDHYMINSSVLNSKVYQGPRFGHFFLMPEDNLIHLYDGTEDCFEGGFEAECPKLAHNVVMIYPKEGSLLRENCACAVQASWVSDEQREATQQWVQFLRQENQQRSFIAAGFRPGTNIPVTDPISPRYGLNPATPKKAVYTERTAPDVAAAIDAAWTDVKKPAVVALVMDVSGSMLGEKLNQAKDGMTRALDNMARNNQVGFVDFSDTVGKPIEVGPLERNGFTISSHINQLRANGGTALYDGILAGIRMADGAEGPEGATRAVVVLTDGKANQGNTHLDQVISMNSAFESPIQRCRGFETDGACVDATGRSVGIRDLTGVSLTIQTKHPVQVFFIGVGDADLQIGRLLAEATRAEFHGVVEKDLANLLEALSKYF